jgi:hypothetical protein
MSEAVSLAKRDQALTHKFFRRYLKLEEPSPCTRRTFSRAYPEKSYPRVDEIETYIDGLMLTVPELKGKKQLIFVTLEIVDAIEKKGF